MDLYYEDKEDELMEKEEELEDTESKIVDKFPSEKTRLVIWLPPPVAGGYMTNFSKKRKKQDIKL